MSLNTVIYLLVAVLLCGTLFAWYNVYLEYSKVCEACNPDGGSIFWSKCFWGAMFFTIAFSLAVYVTYLI